MKASQFADHLLGLLAPQRIPPWYHLAALGCLNAGHVQFINQRNSDDLYLVRMWLTPPLPSTEEGGKFESGGSVLLHWFACGDDDQALHDHPWAFATTILAGGYWEHLPPERWKRERRVTIGFGGVQPTGPAWNARREWRGVGDEVVKNCVDLHCVADPLPDTFTLVRTGKRIREWGFHPEGQPWVSRSVYLDRSKAEGGARV